MSGQKPLICLNMIVRNEARVIERLLQSVIAWVDCYCICDTGSTDNTETLIASFFQKHGGVPGKMCRLPFQDFATNRTYALKQCEGMSEYVLLLDADMVFECHVDLRQLLRGHDAPEACNILQGSDTYYYQNMRLIRNVPELHYVGVTHEYLHVPASMRRTTFPKQQVFIRDIGDGGSKADKFARDIRLLLADLEKDPGNVRSCFYLANSYCDAQQYAEACKWYQKRISMGGWHEERYYSNYRMGFCYQQMQQPEKAVATWLEGLSYHPQRLEGLYEVLKYYCDRGHHQICDTLYGRVEKVLQQPADRDGYLFLHKDVYDYKLHQLYTLFAAYVGKKDISKQIVSILNCCKEDALKTNLLSNMKFYKQRIAGASGSSVQCLDARRTCYLWDGTPMYLSGSSASLLFVPQRQGYLVCQRFVNYHLTSEGWYRGTERCILTHNSFFWLDADAVGAPVHRDSPQYIVEPDPLSGRYVGLEDVRIFPCGDDPESVLYIGTSQWEGRLMMMWGIQSMDESEETALFANRQPLRQTFLPETECEKNWVFVEYQNQPHLIYSWSPLRVCSLNRALNQADLVLERTDVPPLFAYLRGSTCGCPVGEERWFICHIVSHEQPRHYYHVLVILDQNMRVLRYTAPFCFAGEPIEFTIGLQVTADKVHIPFSTWDRTTQLLTLPREEVEKREGGLFYWSQSGDQNPLK